MAFGRSAALYGGREDPHHRGVERRDQRDSLRGEVQAQPAPVSPQAVRLQLRRGKAGLGNRGSGAVSGRQAADVRSAQSDLGDADWPAAAIDHGRPLLQDRSGLVARRHEDRLCIRQERQDDGPLRDRLAHGCRAARHRPGRERRGVAGLVARRTVPGLPGPERSHLDGRNRYGRRQAGNRSAVRAREADLARQRQDDRRCGAEALYSPFPRGHEPDPDRGPGQRRPDLHRTGGVRVVFDPRRGRPRLFARRHRAGRRHAQPALRDTGGREGRPERRSEKDQQRSDRCADLERRLALAALSVERRAADNLARRRAAPHGSPRSLVAA